MKKTILLLITLVGCIHGWAMEISTDSIYNVLSKLYNDKKYSKCIEIADDFIQKYDGIKDSAFVAVLKEKTLAHTKLKQREKCVETLRSSIEIYEKLKKQDSTLHWLYEMYLRTATYKQPDYLQHLHSFIKCDWWTYYDYSTYIECVDNFVEWMDSEERVKFLDAEESIFKNLHKNASDAVFLYAKGHVLYSSKRLYAEDIYIDEGMQYLFSSYEKFKTIIQTDENPTLAKLYFNVLEELAHLSELKMRYLSSISYRQLQLDLSGKYWKKWGDWDFTNPWSGREYSNIGFLEPLPFLYRYVNCLNRVGDYGTIVSTMQDIKQGNDWDLLNEAERDYVENTMSEFSAKIGDRRVSAEEIDEVGSMWNLENEYGKTGDRIEKLLKRNATDEEILKELNELNDFGYDWCISISDPLLIAYGRSKVIMKLVEANIKNDYGINVVDVNSIIKYVDFGYGDISSCLDFINKARDGWHAFGGVMTGIRTWELLECLARAYEKGNKLSQAIRAQEVAVEILRSDKPHPELEEEWDDDEKLQIRNIMVNTLIQVPETIEETLKNEILGYLFMADLYFESGNYVKQYEYLKRAFETSNFLICNEFSIGTDSHSDIVWKNYSNVYTHIMSYLPLAIEKYPKLGELAMSVAYVRQGLTMNQANITRRSALSADDKQIIKYYKSSTSCRRKVEKDLFEYGRIQGDNAITYENELYKFNQLQPVRHIIGKAIINYDSIRNNLREGEVFVDFYTLYNDSIYQYSRSVQDKESRFYAYEGILYAIIGRKSWELPRVIEIGRNHGTDMLDGEWNLEQYMYTDDINRISEIHNDKKFFHYCWDKVLKTAEVKEGETILFVPSDFLHNFAVEFLPINDTQRMTDVYNVKRLSSAIALKSRGITFTEGDVLVAFGNLNYTGESRQVEKANDMAQKERKRRMVKSSLNLIDKSDLEKLDNSELDNIAEILGPQCRTFDGLRGTKLAVTNMDWNAPSFLHISTHGYNLNYSDLSAEEHQVVFGRRDTIYSDAERSMFETGIHLSKSSGENPKDNVISAKEISVLNLHDTKLVVLSACTSSTGVDTSDGVFGLARGFKIAGVKSVIGSLWEVDAEATTLLMTEFYRSLKLDNDAYQSLINAQKAVRNFKGELNDNDIGSEYKYADPYYWAGFIIIDGL